MFFYTAHVDNAIQYWSFLSLSMLVWEPNKRGQDMPGGVCGGGGGGESQWDLQVLATLWVFGLRSSLFEVYFGEAEHVTWKPSLRASGIFRDLVNIG